MTSQAASASYDAPNGYVLLCIELNSLHYDQCAVQSFLYPEMVVRITHSEPLERGERVIAPQIIAVFYAIKLKTVYGEYRSILLC